MFLFPSLLIIAFLILFCVNRVDAAAPPTWEELQKQGAVIAGIRIEVENVFPEGRPESHYWFAYIANMIHVKTRKYVVQRELHFKVGDRVNAAIIHDTERSLRQSLDIARDAVIIPERVVGNRVWVLVVFKDAWSLAMDADFGRVGGQNDYRFLIHERNLLGMGKGVFISHRKTLERSIDEFNYYDPQLFGSLWTLNADYQQLSDGRTRLFSLERPFYTIETPWAVRMSVSDSDDTLTLYDRTRPVYAMRSEGQSVDLTMARAYRTTPGSAYRLGAGLTVKQMTYAGLKTFVPDDLPPPVLEDQRLRGPELTWEWFQDRYRNFTNLRTIGRSEQYNLGWDVTATGGYYSRALGSAVNSPFFQVTATKGWDLGGDTLLLEDGSIQGRYESGRWRNTILTSETALYNQHFSLQTLVAHLRMAYSLRPDFENWLYLGGQNGLRGYPNNFRSGDQRWLMTLEDRLITNQTLWGLLQVGFVGFVDAGAIHAFGAGGWEKPYADVGFGLRCGNLLARHSSVLELTVAVPLVKDPNASSFEIIAGDVLNF